MAHNNSCKLFKILLKNKQNTLFQQENNDKHYHNSRLYFSVKSTRLVKVFCSKYHMFSLFLCFLRLSCPHSGQVASFPREKNYT